MYVCAAGLSEAEVAANAVIGLDQARESLELGGSAAIIAAVNEYRLMYLAKEVLTLVREERQSRSRVCGDALALCFVFCAQFSRWIEVLKAAAALCLVLATEGVLLLRLPLRGCPHRQRVCLVRVCERRQRQGGVGACGPL